MDIYKLIIEKKFKYLKEIGREPKYVYLSIYKHMDLIREGLSLRKGKYNSVAGLKIMIHNSYKTSVQYRLIGT